MVPELSRSLDVNVRALLLTLEFVFTPPAGVPVEPIVLFACASVFARTSAPDAPLLPMMLVCAAVPVLVSAPMRLPDVPEELVPVPVEPTVLLDVLARVFDPTSGPTALLPGLAMVGVPGRVLTFAPSDVFDPRVPVPTFAEPELLPGRPTLVSEDAPLLPPRALEDEPLDELEEEPPLPPLVELLLEELPPEEPPEEPSA